MKGLAFTVFLFLSALSTPLLAQTDTTKKDAKTQAILEELVSKIENGKKNSKTSFEEIAGGIVLDQTKTLLKSGKFKENTWKLSLKLDNASQPAIGTTHKLT